MPAIVLCPGMVHALCLSSSLDLCSHEHGLHNHVPLGALFCSPHHTQRLSWVIDTYRCICPLLAQVRGPPSQCAGQCMLPLNRRLHTGHASQLL